MRYKLFFILSFIAITTFGQNAVNYLRTNDYDRLKISIEDFKKIVASVQYYYNETQQDSTDRYRIVIFKCDFSKKEKSLTLSSFKQVAELNLNGENYSDIVLSYSWNTKPISEVTIFLNNSFRKIKVSGTDEKKVEALYRDIDNQLRSKETPFAWVNWVMTFTFFLYFIFVFALIMCIYTAKNVFSKNRTRQSTVILIVAGFYCFVALGFYFSPLSLGDMFPDFLLTPDKSTWIDRNINLLGFIAFVFTIISIIYKAIRWILEKKATV
jgi:hypothetical protein